MEHYDVVYKSKVFSEAYSKDIPDPLNADVVIKGGTGYCIDTIDGKEIFRQEMNANLPSEIERMRPDYSIYPQYNFAVTMTSRGCPRGCAFCHVKSKEGLQSVKTANVSDFYDGQPMIHCCDPMKPRAAQACMRVDLLSDAKQEATIGTCRADQEAQRKIKYVCSKEKQRFVARNTDRSAVCNPLESGSAQSNHNMILVAENICYHFIV